MIESIGGLSKPFSKGLVLMISLLTGSQLASRQCLLRSWFMVVNQINLGLAED